MINDCVVIAIEGAHGAGKTTFAMALVAGLRAAQQHAVYFGEAGRESPLLDDVLIYRCRAFDQVVELDLMASQILSLTRGTRRARLAVVDRTVFSTMAYARAVLSDRDALAELLSIAKVAGRFYDHVFHLTDKYDLANARGDPYRVAGHTGQEDAERAISRELADSGLSVSALPRSLALPEKTRWAMLRLRELGLVVDPV